MINTCYNAVCYIYESYTDHNGMAVTGTPTEVRAAFERNHRTYPKYNEETVIYDTIIFLPPSANLDIETNDRYVFQEKGHTKKLIDYEIEEIKHQVTGVLHHYEVLCK